MSIQASSYARDTLEHDTELGVAPRLVLMLLAERTNTRTCMTYTGDWLSRGTGLHPGNVRRALRHLETSGYIRCRHRPGRASEVHWPFSPAISTTPAPARGVSDTDPARYRAIPRAVPREPRAEMRAVPGTTGTMYLPPQDHEPGCRCDGTGWIYEESQNGVVHCPGVDLEAVAQ